MPRKNTKQFMQLTSEGLKPITEQEYNMLEREHRCKAIEQENAKLKRSLARLKRKPQPKPKSEPLRSFVACVEDVYL